MDYIFRNFFEDYTKNFDVHNMSGILHHYNYPCLIISGQNVIACKNENDVEEVFRNKYRYVAASFGQMTSYSVKSLVSFDDNNLIVSLLWHTQEKTGITRSDFHCYYYLIKKGGVYKIALAILPEENE
jgi:hypothetical protein